jgi:hypothetical protein
VLKNGHDYQGWIGVAEDGSAEALRVYSDDCSSFFGEPCPQPPTVVGQSLLFVKQYPSELWSTDGTTAGTVAVKTDGYSLEAAALGRLGDGAVVLTSASHLWSTDGTSSGTRFIAQLPTDPENFFDDQFQLVGPPTAFGPLTFLFRRVPVSGRPDPEALEIWRTDGTAEGTLLLASTPFPKTFAPSPNPTVMGGRLFFRFGGTLWMSDGSVQGTHPLQNQLPGGTFAPAPIRSTPSPATSMTTRTTRPCGRSILRHWQ